MRTSSSAWPGQRRRRDGGRRGAHQPRGTRRHPAGDTIYAVNGERVETSRGLIRTVAAVSPGASVNLSIRRQGREIEVPVTVGRRPAEGSPPEGVR